MNNYLFKYGLNKFFTSSLNQNEITRIGKVVAVYKRAIRVITSNGKELIALSKSSHYLYDQDINIAKVGDFVILESVHNENTFIEKILPRKNILERKIVGKKLEKQIIATNIDYAFITNPIGAQFNINKLERLIVACINDNITPVILVTKTDLLKSNEQNLQSFFSTFSNIRIILTSFICKESIAEIKSILKSNKTGVLIGSSGSGKSTIVNILLNKEVQKIQSVSQNKDKGAHTTTYREMFLLPEGGCIIDNPGVREFSLYLSKDNSIDKSFNDILQLAQGCKFSNCSHIHEPDCAVKDAISKNLLSESRLLNYLKLKSEDDALKKSKYSFNKNK